MDKIKVLNEIKQFLDGYNNDLKYLVHVETDPNTNEAECIIDPPGGEKRIEKIEYTPFLYTKDFKKNGMNLYHGDEGFMESQKIKYGIKIERQKTGNQKRLEDGYCYKVTSYKSFNHILGFFKDTGLNPYEKLRDENGQILKDMKGKPIMPNRDLFFTPKLYEQFLIDKKARLYKGYEEYKDVHKLTFDIETTGLRFEISRVFAIGVRDNRGFETILEVDKINDDNSEATLIQDFFNLIFILKPSVIAGFNSEDFDFEYILGRAKILKMDMNKLQTSLKEGVQMKRIPNSSVKIGSNAEKYTATQMWGLSVIDIQHAAKKTAAINTDLKNTKLKYLAKYEEVAKEDRTYIPGEDNDIGRYYHENKVFIANKNNEYILIPNNFQNTAKKLIDLQEKKESIGDSYNKERNSILRNDNNFVEWYKKEPIEKKMDRFVWGRDLVRQYLLDDLWETEQIDELYNQSSFMLAKIVPTVYSRICTMGTASIWNLLMTAWSHHHGLAIPHSDEQKKFSGGLARCYKTGFSERIVKIDYASLYPMEQLTWGIFPVFDITNVFEKFLTYLTTTRNIYKNLANGDELLEEEVELIKSINHETYDKYINNTLTKKEISSFKIKQLPIKILNNSQFGALGSGPSFNWSDNVCAARITCNGRLDLRHAISWFKDYNCIPLLAVTDGVNFKIPNTTKICVTDKGVSEGDCEKTIEEMWQYDGKVGIAALIAKFNKETKENHENKIKTNSYISVDNDGEFISCLNLSRINYALLQEVKDKKTGEIKRKVKLTGNTIKSKVMPEYIEEFIDKGLRLILEGKGSEFVEYYYDYVDNIYYKRIPLKKIASKSKYKNTLKQYLNRGTDKNGRDKGKQAHMELIIMERAEIAETLFQQHKENLILKKSEDKLTIEEKMDLVSVYMPPEPELDSVLYYVNTGYRKSHGDSKLIKDKDTKEDRFASALISTEDLIENPNMLGDYNVDKYLDAFNKRVSTILVGFDPDVANRIPAEIIRKKEKCKITGNMVEVEELKKSQFTSDELKLKNFDNDDYDSSMYLEDKEIEFWNETGFDPRLVWDGFKVREDFKVYYEIYEHALNYLNDKMKKANKPLIKSRNEKINKGDYVLFKTGDRYDIGYNNGEFIEILRMDVPIPKSELEIKLDEISEEKNKRENEKLKKLENIEIKSEKALSFEELVEKRMLFFDSFKERFNIPEEVDYNRFILDAGEEGYKMIDDFITLEESKNNDGDGYYYDVDVD